MNKETLIVLSVIGAIVLMAFLNIQSLTGNVALADEGIEGQNTVDISSTFFIQILIIAAAAIFILWYYYRKIRN